MVSLRILRTTSEDSNLPSGYIFGVFAVAGAVGVADLEDGSDRAPVLAGYALQADVIFAAIIGVSVSRKGAGVAHFSWGRAAEASGYFWKHFELFHMFFH